MKHLQPLLFFAAVAFAGAAWSAETAAPATKSSRACNWDRQTGRMICHRVRAPGTGAPPPASEPTPQPAGKP